MAELADAYDSKSYGEIHEGSTPSLATKKRLNICQSVYFFASVTRFENNIAIVIDPIPPSTGVKMEAWFAISGSKIFR